MAPILEIAGIIRHIVLTGPCRADQISREIYQTIKHEKNTPAEKILKHIRDRAGL
jgi:predicted transcriptional regulator